jgi:RNA polymerase sigma-70 factor (ECF subfamily)
LIDGAIAAGRSKEHSSELAPGDWLMRTESMTSVVEAMKTLDPQDRQILMLKYTEGWGYQDLSDHLGITIKTVEYRLLKARKALRARIGELV